MSDYEELAELGVATVYEASGKAGLIDIALERLIPGSRTAGPARTVRCAQGDNLMVHAAIERIRPGDVVVLTMPEAAPVALIGDLLATQMIAAGAAGVLVDAAVRDADELAGMPLPVWARWIRVRGAEKKVAGELDVPVTVGGACVVPGDAIVLDGDGACVIAAGRLGEVLGVARRRVETERRNRDRYQRGERSLDVNGLRPLLADIRG